MSKRLDCVPLLAVIFVFLGSIVPLRAQDLEPRAYSSAPVGMNFLVLGYGYSTGNVLIDASLPVEDVRASVHSANAAYVRTLSVFGLSSKLLVTAPFIAGRLRGRLAGLDTGLTRTGFADPRIQLSVNFVGAPALSGREFVAYRQRTIVGASLRVTAPLGQYDPNKLINLGSNRWTFRPQLGVSHTHDRWSIDIFTSAWIFSRNTDFFGGSTRTQNPIFGLQTHVSYTFLPGLWVAFDAGGATGGRTSVDRVEGNDLQTNARLGATVAIPLGRQHGLRAAFASGITTRVGADFDNVVVAYQYRWGGT